MVLAELGQKISGALHDLSKKPIVTDEDVKAMLQEVCRALLQADVHVTVVKKLRESVQSEINANKASKGVDMRKVVRGAVFTAVKKVVDPGTKPFVPVKKAGKANVIMFVGLQGSGKTTSCTKYAAYYSRKGFKCALVCADTFRAGAYDQLKQNAAKAKIRFYGNMAESDPVAIAREGVAEMKKENYDIIIVDTSGRHRQEAALFDEMLQVQDAVKPSDIVYVMSSTDGQALHDQAAEFKSKVKVGSVLITKLDSQSAKGGGALSAVATTGSPVGFIGTGEHFDDFEQFNPQSFVSKMLGFGDMSGLAQVIQDAKIDANPELFKRFTSGSFTMRDMNEHLENIGKLGSMDKIMEMIPGMSGMMKDMPAMGDQSAIFNSFRYMMNSMTNKEMDDPDIASKMTESRMSRIARGSGRSMEEVHQFLVSYKKFSEMSSKMGGMDALKNGGMDQMGGRGGQANMAQLAKAMDPNILKKLGGAGNMQNMMKQLGAGLGGGKGGGGMPGMPGGMGGMPPGGMAGMADMLQGLMKGAQ